MQAYLRSMTALSLMLVVAGACATPAESKALEGLAAFKACDLRAASRAFDDAHSLDPSRADFALAYALSTLAILAEDPAVTGVLAKLGFDAPIDTSAFWGRGGVLDHLSARNAMCQAIWDYVRTKIPYAAAQKNGPSAASVVRDPNLNGDDFVAAAAALSPRLQRLVQALEQAAAGAAGTDIEGGCGVGKVHIEAPELYGLAAAIEAVRASVQAAQGYDWAVPATLVLDTSGREQASVAALNAHFFHLKSAAALKGAQPTLLHVVELLQRGIASAATISSRQPNSLFDWTKMPAGTLDDLKTLVDSAHQVLTAPGQHALPSFSPALAMDGVSFFDSPVDATGVKPPIWSAAPSMDTSGVTRYSVQSSSAGAEAQLAPRFSPYPFGNPALQYSFSLSDGWKPISSDTWLSVFDPDRRWRGTYGCTN
jgi:hypothetical protein